MVNCYWFDLEGTLSNSDHREHLRGQWDKYHYSMINDKPRRDIIHLATTCARVAPIQIITSKPIKYHQVVVDWMVEHRLHEIFPPWTLHMRPDDNNETSPEFKTRFFAELEVKPIMVFDDRGDTVEALLNNGYPAIQV